MTFTDGPDGSTDQAIAFDGTYGLTIRASEPDLSTTYGFWFRAQSTDALYLLSTGGVEIQYDVDDGFLIYRYSSGVAALNAVPAGYDTGWHFCAVKVDTSTSPTTISTYFDGTLIFSDNSREVPEPDSSEVRVGYSNYSATVPAYSDAFDFFDFSQWPELKDISDLETYRAAVVADPDSVLPPEEP